MAVLNAGVMATLQRLGTNATGGKYPPVQVPLLDLGTGGEYCVFTIKLTVTGIIIIMFYAKY